MTPVTGKLVVKANPSIEIRGTVDWMPCCTWIRAATLNEDGSLEIEHQDAYKDFSDGMVTQTRAGATLYDDEHGNEYVAEQLAILTPDGRLVDLPAERPGKPVFDAEYALSRLEREILRGAFAVLLNDDADTAAVARVADCSLDDVLEMMRRFRVTDPAGEDDNDEPCRECGAVPGSPGYGTVGDGFDGLCPSCADREEEDADA